MSTKDLFWRFSIRNARTCRIARIGVCANGLHFGVRLPMRKSYQSFSVSLHKTDIGEKRAYLIVESVDHFLTTSWALKTYGTDENANAATVYPLQNS
jgi:hypothetical protein